MWFLYPRLHTIREFGEGKMNRETLLMCTWGEYLV